MIRGIVRGRRRKKEEKRVGRWRQERSERVRGRVMK